MLWNSSGSIVYFGFQWLITIFVVRLSDGFEAAGVLSLAMAVYNIFNPLAVYRMYTYQVSDVRHENTAGEYFAFRAITSGIALLGCMVWAAFTAPPSTLLAVFLFVVFKVCSLLIDPLHGVDQVNGRMDYIGTSLALQGVATFAVFMTVFGFTHNLELALAGMAVATVAVGVLYDLPRTRQFGPITPRITGRKTSHLLRYCLPIVVAAVACAAAPSIPRQMLAAVEGEGALGIYASVAAPVAIVQMGATYLYNPLLSVIAELYTTGRIAQLSRMLTKVVLGVAGIGVLAAIGLEIAGGWLLTLMFGARISEYTYLLLPLIISAIVSAYVWFLSDLLVAVRSFRTSLIGNVLSVVIASAVSYFFIQLWGMNGPSFTVIAAYGAGSIVMVIGLRRTLGARRAASVQ